MDINEEILALKKKLEALEAKKKEIEEYKRKTNIKANLETLDQAIETQKMKIYIMYLE